MTPDELQNKNSIHGSGIVKKRTVVDGHRESYKISPPRDGFTSLPLVAVLSMHPTRYPVSLKTPRPTDIVIEIGQNSSVPFGSLFYLNKTKVLEPPPVIGAKRLYETFITASVPFGECQLCVSIYADSSHMKLWPELEGSLTALPVHSGGEPSWPFFANTSIVQGAESQWGQVFQYSMQVESK